MSGNEEGQPLAGLSKGKSGEIMIDCPYCSFRRPVAACLATCEFNIVNWCQKIKTIPVEDLDEAAPKALQGKEHLKKAWEERRSFFVEPVRGTPRPNYEDDYEPEAHGGGGVMTAEELKVVQSQDAEPEDEPQDPEGDDLPPGPHTEGEDQQDDLGDDGQDPEDQQGDDGEAGGDDPDGDDGGASGDTKTGEEAQVSTEEQLPCTVEGCDYVAKSERALKIHTTRAHGEGGSQEPKASKKAAKKKSRGKSIDTGKLIVVAGSTCAIVNAGQDLSEALGTVSEHGKAKIYKLGPEVRIRTVIEEV